MPKYESNAYISHEGKIVQPGESLILTKEQAKNLGDNVKTIEGAQLSENEFRNLSAQEQKDLVEEKGGDLEELTNEDKRAQYFMDHQ